MVIERAYTPLKRDGNCPERHSCNDYEQTSEACQYHELSCPTYFKIKMARRLLKAKGQQMLVHNQVLLKV